MVFDVNPLAEIGRELWRAGQYLERKDLRVKDRTRGEGRRMGLIEAARYILAAEDEKRARGPVELPSDADVLRRCIEAVDRR